MNPFAADLNGFAPTAPMRQVAPLSPRIATELAALRPRLDALNAGFRALSVEIDRAANTLAVLARAIELETNREN